MSLLHALKATMPEPQAFGTFHLVSVALTVLLSILLCVFFRNAKEKTYRNILLILWAVMAAMELIKQFSEQYYFADDGALVWEYYWPSFPFQLCSLPLYTLLPIALLKDGRARDALSAFMFTFVLLGGLTVYIVPSTVFNEEIYHNVQTMTHHGLQIVSCIYVAAYNRKRIRLVHFAYALLAFVASVIVATLLNVGLHPVSPEQPINMFYVSPYFTKTVPILNEQWKSLHWVPRMLLYVAGLAALAFAIFMIVYLVTWLTSRRHKKA